MYLRGSTGTGKSRVIEASIEAFSQLKCVEQLLVCATTGLAANLIGGSTVDSLLKLRRGRGRYKVDRDEMLDGSETDGFSIRCCVAEFFQGAGPGDQWSCPKM